MRIYSVRIHGTFNANVRMHTDELFARGFYTTRWVLAGNEAEATKKAFGSARQELSEWSDLRDGLVSVMMEVEDIGPGSVWRWLRGGARLCLL